MAKIYLGKEETARSISSYMGNTCGELVNPNFCNQETLQDIADLLGTPDDTGGTVDSGTIFAKVNAILTQLQSGCRTKLRPPISLASYKKKATINGKGILYFSSSYYSYPMNRVKVDGKTLSSFITYGDSYPQVIVVVPFFQSVQITNNLTDEDGLGGVCTIALY